MLSNSGSQRILQGLWTRFLFGFGIYGGQKRIRNLCGGAIHATAEVFTQNKVCRKSQQNKDACQNRRIPASEADTNGIKHRNSLWCHLEMRIQSHPRRECNLHLCGYGAMPW